MARFLICSKSVISSFTNSYKSQSGVFQSIPTIFRQIKTNNAEKLWRENVTITTLEFCGKTTQREESVQNNNFQFFWELITQNVC
jgi:hypothetical protein